MSSSKLSALCDKIIEAGWLIALVVTPLFFNMDSRRGFEADKLTLLRSLATVMAIAWLIQWMEQRQTSRGSATFPLRTALTLATLIFVAAHLLATLTSIVPRISFFGSYTRLQGTYTLLSYVVIFLLIAQGLRTRRQLDRLLVTIILASVPVALYAAVQSDGLDPLWEPGGLFDRVFANMGNPIYLAAYLGMALFLTLAKIAERAATLRINGKISAANLLLLAAYVLIALAQIAAIAFASSRGPFLGILAGLALFTMLLALIFRRRALALGLMALGLIGLAFLLAINLPNSPLANLRQMSTIGRMFNLASNPGDSAQARVLIWEGSAMLVQPHAPIQFPDGTLDALNVIRPLIGYGPESMYLVFSQYYPPALAAQTGYGGDTFVGRSHNETWDALIDGGLLGLLAYQALFLGFFLTGLQSLGLALTQRERNLFIGLWTVMGLMGALAAVMLGAPQYIGVAIASGTLIALALYLIALTTRRAVNAPGARRGGQIMLAALMSAVLAHYVEIQFGFGVASTRLLFWVCAALLVAVGFKERLTQDASSDAPAPARIESVVSYALIVGVALVTLLFEFVTNNEQLANPAAILWRALTFNNLRNETSSAVLGILALFWTAAAVVVFAELIRAGVLKSFRAGIVAFTLFAMLSLGAAAAFGLGRANQLRVLAYPTLGRVEDALALADYRVGLFDYFVFSVFLLFLLMAIVLLAEERQLPAAWSENRWSWAALAPLALAGFVWLNATNLDPVRADIIYNLGQAQRFEYAIALDKRALDRAPYEDVYYRGLGYALIGLGELTRADRAARWDERTPLEEIWKLSAAQTAELARADLFYAARAVFVHGRVLTPLNPDHTVGMARLYRQWASLTDDPAQKSKLAEPASENYARALTLRPQDANLRNAWAEFERARNVR